MKNTRKPRKPEPQKPSPAWPIRAETCPGSSPIPANDGADPESELDLASGMLEELDRAAKELNISRQA